MWYIGGYNPRILTVDPNFQRDIQGLKPMQFRPFIGAPVLLHL